MAKVKVKNGTRTVWMVETKQVDYELEDGRVLGIRVKEDDNGSETFYCWADEDGVIHRRGNWIDTSNYEHEYEDEETKELVEKLSGTIFMDDYEDGEEVDTDELDEELW
jgi:hypothetical protein